MSAGTQTLESMSQAVWYNRWTLDKFKKYLKGDILEVGCGIGNFTDSLNEYGEIYAIDIDNSYINKVKELVYGRAGFGDIETGEYFFKDKKFDTIVCLNVLEHIQKDEVAVKNLYKLLKDEGHLILLVPVHPFMFGKIDESIGHFRRYTKEKIIQEINDAGFKIILSRKLNFLGAIGWWLAQKVFKEKTIKESNIQIFNILAPLVLPLEDIIEPPLGTSILVIAQKKL
ncbi:MAG: class I SAM-dependent methyltransferase [Candidatus Daviesbacteria bacterium]|nr:class I SAM-dependent methyltransferase [Candidatus Daviesbacteria bacterium]